MIELFTWPTPNGRKASIALEEFELDYEVRAVDITKEELFVPSFLNISPNNKIPALVDHESGRTLMESGAILIYLADRCERFWGKDRYQTIEWLMLQMASVGPMLGQVHYFARYNAGKAPFAEQRFHNEAQRLYGVLNKRLAEKEFLAGEYSIADMATWPWISRFQWQQIELAEFPHVRRWYEQIAAREAVQKGYHVPVYVNDIPLP